MSKHLKFKKAAGPAFDTDTTEDELLNAEEEKTVDFSKKRKTAAANLLARAREKGALVKKILVCDACGNVEPEIHYCSGDKAPDGYWTERWFGENVFSVFVGADGAVLCAKADPNSPGGEHRGSSKYLRRYPTQEEWDWINKKGYQKTKNKGYFYDTKKPK